jgi:transposase
MRAVVACDDQIAARHQAHVSNGPTEAALTTSSSASSVSRFGLRRFTNYRIRALLYAGQPNWDLTRHHHTR